MRAASSFVSLPALVQVMSVSFVFNESWHTHTLAHWDSGELTWVPPPHSGVIKKLIAAGFWTLWVAAFGKHNEMILYLVNCCIVVHHHLGSQIKAERWVTQLSWPFFQGAAKWLVKKWAWLGMWLRVSSTIGSVLHFQNQVKDKAVLKPLAKNKKLQWKDSGLKSISINYCQLQV